ncbi:MAG: hypothetical protein EXR50_02820 [Dehalococcoidia bacterium]|nr:hypothetical protein [Dehalococcoidia bacterium]
MPAPSVYADATALIGLARIGRLERLTLLPTPIRVTEVVWGEIAADLGKPGALALHESRTAGLLLVVDEGDSEAFSELDAGESSVLSAAAAARAAVLVDERRARAAIDAHRELRDTIV